MDMIHTPRAGAAHPLPTGGGTMVRFGFREKWRPRMGLPPQRLCDQCSALDRCAIAPGAAPSTVRFRGGCSAIELQDYRLRNGSSGRRRPGMIFFTKEVRY